MIRALLTFLLFALIFQAARVLLRSLSGEPRAGQKSRRIPGEEMVLDPECRTYVVKGRAVIRTVDGQRRYFCSEACAQKFELRDRS